MSERPAKTKIFLFILVITLLVLLTSCSNKELTELIENNESKFISTFPTGAGEGGGTSPKFIIQYGGTDAFFVDKDSNAYLGGNMNITGNASVEATLYDDGGKIVDNSTCTTIYSPDGTSIVEVCN